MSEAAAEADVGRNAPCPCGSGKRFKQCCGREGAVDDTSSLSAQSDAFGLMQAREARADKKFDEAITILKQVVQRNPRHREALQMLAGTLLEQGKLDEAEHVVRHSMQQAGAHYANHYIYAMICKARGAPEDAISHYQQALALDPREYTYTIHGYLGACFHDMGRWEEAIESYWNALRHNPYFGAAYIRLARAYLGQGQPGPVSDDDTGMQDALMLQQAGDLLLRRGEYKRAALLFQQSVMRMPSLDVSWALLADARFRLGDLQGARQLYEYIAQNFPACARAKEDFAARKEALYSA